MKNNFFWTVTLFLSLVQITLAQNSISGTIRDANGPLPGANVIESGTDNGVSTDFDGNFQISIAEGAILEISYTGYFTQTIEVGNQSNFDILMEEDTEQLDEVVVTSLGFTEKRDKLGSTYSVVSTGAVPMVDADNTRKPERMPYAQNELNSNSNAPAEDPGIFVKTPVNK